MEEFVEDMRHCEPVCGAALPTLPAKLVGGVKWLKAVQAFMAGAGHSWRFGSLLKIKKKSHKKTRSIKTGFRGCPNQQWILSILNVEYLRFCQVFFGRVINKQATTVFNGIDNFF